MSLLHNKLMTVVDDPGFLILKHISIFVVAETLGLTQFLRFVQNNTCSTVRNISLNLSCKSFQVLSPETMAVFSCLFRVHHLQVEVSGKRKEKREGNLGQKCPHPCFWLATVIDKRFWLDSPRFLYPSTVYTLYVKPCICSLWRSSTRK